jgi:hypothetical protein
VRSVWVSMKMKSVAISLGPQPLRLEAPRFRLSDREAGANGPHPG